MARHGRISGRTLAGAAALAVVGVGALGGTASAHTPSVTSTCTTATVKLTGYNDKVTNTVTVTIDGKVVVDHQTFGGTFKQDFPIAAHTKPVHVVADVIAGDDLKGHNGWTGQFPTDVPVCPPPTTPPASPTPTPTPSPTPTPTAAPTSKAPTTKAPSPSPTGPQLASTGGGSNSGLIAGIGVGVLVIGGGLVFATRRRANRH
ncbi:hypothetical protein C7C46_24460 [Streptomyces tateyamensis]|uniref:Gram-positive cocci surface proteins LPxTG domain-containing protein n=1 Tax=Streptomyces tateyamensis TaxID=565073 RepID=A0A2V4NAQ1_9ACTN|nr:LAETG motif-containing sortase-dependent surface protein [Streptomyces tateyamensis]PYC73969.1 hypothetical protein C7C46_24460 [Streptomyces tateyamensis]